MRLKEKGQDLRSIDLRLNGALQASRKRFAFALLPPPIQGIGNVGGFTMQVELKNGNFDYALLQSLTNAVVADGNAQSRCRGSPRPSAPARRSSSSTSTGSRPRRSASRSARCSPPFPAMSDRAMWPSSTNSDMSSRSMRRRTAAYRATADDIRNLKVKAGDGTMTPIGTVVEISEVQGPLAHQPLQSLSVVHRRRQPGARLQLRPGARHHGPDRRACAADRDGLRMDGDVVPGKAGRHADLLRLRVRAAARLFRAGGPVRELDPAARRDPRGAAGPARDGRRSPTGATNVAAKAASPPTTSTPRSASSC